MSLGLYAYGTFAVLLGLVFYFHIWCCTYIAIQYLVMKGFKMSALNDFMNKELVLDHCQNILKSSNYGEALIYAKDKGFLNSRGEVTGMGITIAEMTRYDIMVHGHEAVTPHRISTLAAE